MNQEQMADKIARERLAESAMDRIVKRFDYLEARWGDESEYEDFAEYEQVAKKAVEKEGFKFVSLKKQPMKLVFRDKSAKYEIYIKGNQIQLDTTR
jgi:predicted transcriptional regulator